MLGTTGSADLSKVLGSYDRYVEVFSKATVDVVLSHEVPARRLKRDSGVASTDESTSQAVEMTIWLKDFPQTVQEFKAFYGLKQSIHGMFLVEEKFVPEEADDYTLQTLNSGGSGGGGLLTE